MDRSRFGVEYKASVECDLRQEVADQRWFPNLDYVTLNDIRVFQSQIM